VTPAAFAEKVDLPQGWCVISYRCFSDRKFRRHAHGRWFQIKSDQGCVHRVLRFSAKLRAPKKTTGEIVLDWVGWLDLNGRDENVDEPLKLRISPVAWWRTPLMAKAYPDPTVRLAAMLGLISVGLGILSLVLSLL
jgi:hypothetical protein